MRFRFITIALFTLLIAASAFADTTYRPFVLASVSEDGLEARTNATL